MKYQIEMKKEIRNCGECVCSHEGVCIIKWNTVVLDKKPVWCPLKVVDAPEVVMKRFKIQVSVEGHNFNGQFTAPSRDMARKDALEYYAFEFNTGESQVEVLSIEEDQSYDIHIPYDERMLETARYGVVDFYIDVDRVSDIITLEDKLNVLGYVIWGKICVNVKKKLAYIAKNNKLEVLQYKPYTHISNNLFVVLCKSEEDGFYTVWMADILGEGTLGSGNCYFEDRKKARNDFVTRCHDC